MMATKQNASTHTSDAFILQVYKKKGNMPARPYIGIVFQFDFGEFVWERAQRVPTCDAARVLFRVVSQRLSHNI